MSERDPRYNPIELLINASDSETETAAEWSSLYDFKKVAEELEKEKAKRDNFVRHSAYTSNLQPEIQEWLRLQAAETAQKIKQLSDQLREISQSEVLKPVVWKAYRKVVETDLIEFKKEQEAEFQRNLQKIIEDNERKRRISEETRRNQQAPVVQAVTHTPKNAATPSHSTNTSPAIVRSPMNKLLSVLLVICIILLCISIFKNIDYTTQIAAHAQALEDAYDEGYDDGYTKGFHQARNQMIENAIKPSPKTMPTSGTIVSGQQGYGSTLTIKSDTDSACVVSLKTTQGVERMAFFVRAGDIVTVNVPAEQLYAYFAYGNTWYGYGEGLMFGEDTVYSRDDEALYFGQYTYTYTLYPTYNGNFTETPSDEDEFFG